MLPDSSCRNRNIGKVSRYEERMAELCCEDELRPEVGRVVAVRAGEGMVRGRVGEVGLKEVKLFLLDRGQTVSRARSELLRLPPGLKEPGQGLAQRLVLEEAPGERSEQLLLLLLAECREGRLDQLELSPCEGWVTGRLTVSPTLHSPLLQGCSQSSLCVNSWLEAGGDQEPEARPSLSPSDASSKSCCPGPDSSRGRWRPPWLGEV